MKPDKDGAELNYFGRIRLAFENLLQTKEITGLAFNLRNSKDKRDNMHTKVMLIN